jgi:hypothetical protein
MHRDDTGLIVAVAKSAPDPAAVICPKVGLPATAVRTLVLDELPRNANGKPDYAAVQRSAGPRPETAAELAVKADGVQALYREILKADEVSDTDTFVSLGGDSLSFVVTSQRLERQLGALPEDWHLLTVAELEAGARNRPRGPLRWMETSIVLRALAIVMVCANHVGLTQVFGGAHVLLAVAGYSFARFQVNAVASSGRVRPLFQSIARIAVPSVVVIAIASVVTRHYAVGNVLLIEHLFDPDVGPDGWDPRWDYWFIEVLRLDSRSMGSAAINPGCTSPRTRAAVRIRHCLSWGLPGVAIPHFRRRRIDGTVSPAHGRVVVRTRVGSSARDAG